MKCPGCGSRVPDGALTCPRCHRALDVTQRLSLRDATWCPGCGALVAPGVDVCPKCGSSVRSEPEAAPVRPTRDLDLPEIGNTGVMEPVDEAGETGVITRIESAIPTADDASSPTSRVDRMPRTRAFALAALLAVVVVGGAALLITHPWDPSATRISATTPADTSMQGFPGFLESLTGQDGSGAQQDDDVTAERLQSAWESLGELSSRVDESEAELRERGASGSADERSQGLSDAEDISLEVSNLITETSGIDDGSGPNAEEVQNLVTLGSWLRNRCDALTSAWKLLADASDPEGVAGRAVSTMDGAADYERLFSQNYDAWRPTES